MCEAVFFDIKGIIKLSNGDNSCGKVAATSRLKRQPLDYFSPFPRVRAHALAHLFIKVFKQTEISAW